MKDVAETNTINTYLFSGYDHRFPSYDERNRDIIKIQWFDVTSETQIRRFVHSTFYL